MALKAFTIRDSKAESFNTPFFVGTPGEAERAFKRLLDDDRSMIGQFPEDYDLYFIGEYDETTGKFLSEDTPVHMIKAIQLKKPSVVQSPKS